METMSITRALVTLKRLNDRISHAISKGKFISRTSGKNNFKKVTGSNDSVEAMTAKIQGSFDSVDTLITQRGAIKSAIVLSNANTDVVIAGRTMKVCEAIELKSTVDFRKAYLASMRLQLMTETRHVEVENEKLNTSIEGFLSNIYGSEKSKINDDTYKLVADPQKEQKEAALLDPQKIEQRITQLEEEISIIESEIDFCLGESNARTNITV